MVPFVAAAIPALLQAAPSLIRIFGDSPQAEKNAKTAEAVAAIAREVTAEPTIEGAVNKLQADPVMAKTFSSAIEEKWFALTGEAGGGGIAGARQADAAAVSGAAPWKSPTLWISLTLLPLVYLVVSAVLFGAGWLPEIRAMVVSQVISLVLGGVVGFYLGTSLGSEKKTNIIAERR